MSVDCEKNAVPLAGDANMDFSEKTIRTAFIKKVFLILAAQLMVTFGIIAVFTLVDDVRLLIVNTPEIFWSALGLSLVCIMLLCFCGSIRRRYPFNVIGLGIFTVCEGIMLGVVAAAYTKDVILMSVGICAVVTFALTLFAFQTKIDFTIMGGCLFAGLNVILLFGILTIFFYDRILNIVYSSLAAMLFSLYLVYDVQLIIGEKHKYTISPEEYVLAALNIYLDVIMLFLSILGVSS